MAEVTFAKRVTFDLPSYVSSDEEYSEDEEEYDSEDVEDIEFIDENDNDNEENPKEKLIKDKEKCNIENLLNEQDFLISKDDSNSSLNEKLILLNNNNNNSVCNNNNKNPDGLLKPILKASCRLDEEVIIDLINTVVNSSIDPTVINTKINATQLKPELFIEEKEIISEDISDKLLDTQDNTDSLSTFEIDVDSVKTETKYVDIEILSEIEVTSVVSETNNDEIVIDDTCISLPDTEKYIDKSSDNIDAQDITLNVDIDNIVPNTDIIPENNTGIIEIDKPVESYSEEVDISEKCVIEDTITDNPSIDVENKKLDEQNTIQESTLTELIINEDKPLTESVEVEDQTVSLLEVSDKADDIYPLESIEVSKEPVEQTSDLINHSVPSIIEEDNLPKTQTDSSLIDLVEPDAVSDLTEQTKPSQSEIEDNSLQISSYPPEIDKNFEEISIVSDPISISEGISSQNEISNSNQVIPVETSSIKEDQHPLPSEKLTVDSQNILKAKSINKTDENKIAKQQTVLDKQENNKNIFKFSTNTINSFRPRPAVNVKTIEELLNEPPKDTNDILENLFEDVLRPTPISNVLKSSVSVTRTDSLKENERPNKVKESETSILKPSNSENKLKREKHKYKKSTKTSFSVVTSNNLPQNVLNPPASADNIYKKRHSRTGKMSYSTPPTIQETPPSPKKLNRFFSVNEEDNLNCAGEPEVLNRNQVR